MELRPAVFHFALFIALFSGTSSTPQGSSMDDHRHHRLDTDLDMPLSRVHSSRQTTTTKRPSFWDLHLPPIPHNRDYDDHDYGESGDDYEMPYDTGSVSYEKEAPESFMTTERLQKAGTITTETLLSNDHNHERNLKLNSANYPAGYNTWILMLPFLIFMNWFSKSFQY